MKGNPKTIRDCIALLSDTPLDFSKCDSLTQEFAVIKAAHRAKILVVHPDKGGDSESFRNVQAAFEVLKGFYQKKSINSFATHLQEDTAGVYDETFQDFHNTPVPPWDFYAEAPEEDVPGYRVEPAKSGRSKCKAAAKKTKFTCMKESPYIPKGHVRVGSLEEEAGTYTRWHHLDCWRVPSSIWLGLPPSLDDEDAVRKALMAMNSVLLSGVDELSEDDMQLLIAHVVDKSHWAKRIKRRTDQRPPAPAAASMPGDIPSSNATAPGALASHDKTLSTRVSFVPPRPGFHGAKAEALAGKRVVLTGLFPEVGGGKGLNLGKERVKGIVESFGGRVTSAVSGKTDYLLVGRQPGESKVSKARERNIQLLTIQDFKEGLEGDCLEALKDKPLEIASFSSGYKFNAVGLLGPATKPSPRGKRRRTKKA